MRQRHIIDPFFCQQEGKYLHNKCHPDKKDQQTKFLWQSSVFPEAPYCDQRKYNIGYGYDGRMRHLSDDQLQLQPL